MREPPMTAADPKTIPEQAIDWDKVQGLLPVIVQDVDSHRVLMMAYMDRDALAKTLESGLVSFFSRTRQRLWTKGETSGHTLQLVSMALDCDGDALLVQARPKGPTCHRNTESCFDPEAGISASTPHTQTAEQQDGFLSVLDDLIAERERDRPADSYTTRLFAAGVPRIAQKVGEEGVETALAAVIQDDAALLGEAADLLYHLLVLLRARGLGLAQLQACLRARHAPRA